MTQELLSRFQFALTASFHYIYPPISIGLGLLLVIIGVIYVRTRNPMWRRLSFFWVKIYGLVFALGIATGLVQEFEFGTNWANYSRFVGNIFGSLLAAEGIFAFFLEGGFLGLMLFGGNRLGPRLWLLATFLVAFGAHFSALWIVMANSWMQTPAGYVMQDTANGLMPVMTSFTEIIFTPSFLARIGHVLVSAWMVGAALMLSVSAWYLLKKRHVEIAKANFKVALPVFVVFSILQVIVFGTQSAMNVTAYQPVKLAAMEGLWETQSCAPMMIVGWVDEATQTTYGIGIPCMLSFLAYEDFQAPVQGLTSVPPSLWPSINLTFQAYHLMINLGVLFIPIGLLGAALYFWKRKVFETRWVLWIFVLSIFMAELATLSGWWTAEFGRQPWIVYNLLLTADAGSPLLTVNQVLFSVGMFVVLYIILFILFIYLLNEKIQHGPDPLDDEVAVSSLPDTFREIFRQRSQMEGEIMWLNEIWFVLFVLIIAGYLILDGFDLGVGILHLVAAKTDNERRIMLNAIGPVWDGNEVWLVVGGGALFAAFPMVYASLFSGFYIAMMLILLFLILRTVAIEFRSKREDSGWRSFWDFIFFLSSLAIAVLLGVAFGNIIGGVPVDGDGNIQTTLVALLTPFALLIGVTTVFMLALHGAIYLTMKTEGDLQARIRGWIPRLMVLFFLLNTATVAVTVFLHNQITDRYLAMVWPVIFPAGALAAVLVAWWMLRTGHDFIAFLASSVMVAMLLLSVAVGVFPNLLVSTIDPSYNLTIYNAAAAPNSLQVMLIIAFIGMPFVVLYTAGVYYIFRGKVAIGPRSY